MNSEQREITTFFGEKAAHPPDNFYNLYDQEHGSPYSVSSQDCTLNWKSQREALIRQYGLNIGEAIKETDGIEERKKPIIEEDHIAFGKSDIRYSKLLTLPVSQATERAIINCGGLHIEAFSKKQIEQLADNIENGLKLLVIASEKIMIEKPSDQNPILNLIFGNFYEKLKSGELLFYQTNQRYALQPKAGDDVLAYDENAAAEHYGKRDLVVIQSAEMMLHYIWSLEQERQNRILTKIRDINMLKERFRFLPEPLFYMEQHSHNPQQ